MSTPFFERPILNAPYGPPRRHWELDQDGQPTQRIIETRREAAFVSPIPIPRKRKKGDVQQTLILDEGHGLSTREQLYAASMINNIRREVQRWRNLPNPGDWQVTPETARLLQYWRNPDFPGLRPFFCQIEAFETAVWLAEVAHRSKIGRAILDDLEAASAQANPGLSRIALKLATGAGKTTVMAMLIAWQTVNAVRRPGGKNFTRGFLIVAPGLTIRDRLRVLQPNDPDNYYTNRMLAPGDMLNDLTRAKIVITNYHAFKRRDRMGLASGTRALLQGQGCPSVIQVRGSHTIEASRNIARIFVIPTPSSAPA